MLEALKKLFGSKHEKDVKAIQPLVTQINIHYEELQQLSDEALRAKTEEFRTRIREAIKETE